MRLVRSIAAFSATLDAARARGERVGLVPTMGALHAGHRSLLHRAARECGCVAATIFVNPLQFGDAADLDSYPRSLAADLDQCGAAGVDLVFAPEVDEMYPCWPDPPPTTVSVRGVTEAWEGASRAGHFDGVTTVVAKLFAAAGRCRAYFGEKDFQQLVTVCHLVADLSFPVEIVPCPTVREPDGLALSSRNVRLSAPQRRAAPVLAAALDAGRHVVERGEPCPGVAADAMARAVAAEPAAVLDYAAVVHPTDLRVPASLEPGGRWRLLVAARFGDVRLIDNCEASSPPRRAAAGPPRRDAASSSSTLVSATRHNGDLGTSGGHRGPAPVVLRDREQREVG